MILQAQCGLRGDPPLPSLYGFVSGEALAAGVVFADPDDRVKGRETDTTLDSTPHP